MYFKKDQMKDWWKEISDSEKNSIQLGVADAENSCLKLNSEAEKIYGKWL